MEDCRTTLEATLGKTPKNVNLSTTRHKSEYHEHKAGKTYRRR
jgi:hypothetical protein